MEYISENFDIAVIGAGHAGIEAALASARLGLDTILFTMNLDSVGNMPCNPSIGGTAKGHLVREIDALGGEMGKNIDKTFIQSKMLNTAKGPAVHSLRAQADKNRYHEEMKKICEELSEKYNIEFLYRDFRVGFREGQAKCRELGLYMQKYCGCIFSI